MLSDRQVAYGQPVRNNQHHSRRSHTMSSCADHGHCKSCGKCLNGWSNVCTAHAGRT